MLKVNSTTSKGTQKYTYRFWFLTSKGTLFWQEQEGNVLRNLRPAMFQMLMGKTLRSLVQMSMMSKCPNVHDVQISMKSKWPWCPNICNVVTIFTYGHNFHMWSHLSHVVTLVTCGHMCHITKWETNVSNADQKVPSLSDMTNV